VDGGKKVNGIAPGFKAGVDIWKGTAVAARFEGIPTRGGVSTGGTIIGGKCEGALGWTVIAGGLVTAIPERALWARRLKKLESGVLG